MTTQLRTVFDAKATEIEKLTAGLTEEQANKRPAESEWSVRDVLCHLSGDAEHGFRDDLNRFLNEDKPELDLSPGDLYWNPHRESCSTAELARTTAAQYREIGEFVAGLSDDQLSRIGRIAFLKQARGNDEIKMSEWISLIANYHLEQHLGQLRDLTR